MKERHSPFPRLDLPAVWHVGTLNPALGDPTGYEGNLLSVSTCPASWMRIARLSGDLWRIENPEMQFVDAHAFRQDPSCFRMMLDWACGRNLVAFKTVYHVDLHDEEMGEMTWSFETLEDLERELGDEDLEIRRADLVPVLTDVGLERFRLKRNGSQFNMDYVLIDYFERVLRHEDRNLLGIWWDDRMDPAALSAPRAGISPGCLDRVTITREDRTPEEVEALHHPDEMDGFSI